MRVTPVKHKLLARVFELDGYTLDRVEGSHHIYRKPGSPRPVVIPYHGKDVRPWVIIKNMQTAQMSRERYFHLLAQAKKSKA